MIPLNPGTEWFYEADVRWTPVDGDSRDGVQSQRIRWQAKVLSCVASDCVQAAVVHAFPMEILGMDPEEPTGYTVLVETTNRLYSIRADSASEARTLARGFAVEPRKLAAQAQLLLEFPLKIGKRWGDGTDDPPRDDGWYCWHVEAKETQQGGGQGLFSARKFEVWRVAFRTNPDHQVLHFLPGVGFTHLEYEHHGTVGCENVRLVRFKPSLAKPEALTAPARSR